MRFLLDSNAVIAILKKNPKVLEHARSHASAEIGMSAIGAHELFYGALKSHRVAQNLKDLETLRIEMLSFDTEDARVAGALRAHLAAAGTPIGPYDVLIAAQALARDLTLVTNNTREFQRVPKLRIEDWQ